MLKVRARNGAGLYGSYSASSDGINVNIPLPVLTTISPNVSLNTGLIEVALEGANFISRPNVKLSRKGQPDIVANGVTIESPNKITCNFDLKKTQAGKWDVVVSNTEAKSCVVTRGFKILMDPSKKQEVYDGKTKVEIAPFAIGEAYYITIDLNPNSSEIDTANYKDDLDLSYNRISDSIAKIASFNENDTLLTNNFIAPATITISYLDSNQDGIVDNTNPPIKEIGLGIYKLVGTGGTSHWERIQASSVDSLANIVKAPITSFSTYVLIGPVSRSISLENIYLYPNPAFPKDERIIFNGISPGGIIRIYNIARELIIEKEISRDYWIWDMKNKEGKKVASGVYIWMIEDKRPQKTFGKIGIIK